MSLAPGWYRDPAEPTTQRWWDGEGWIGDPLPVDETPPPGPPPEQESGGAGGAHAPQVPAVPGPPGASEIPPTPGHGRPNQEVPPHRAHEQPGPQRTGQPGSGQLPTRPHGYPPAALGSRFLARLVDVAIVFALNVAVNGWFVYQYWTEVSPVLAEAWRRSLAGQDVSELPEVGDQAGYLQIVIVFLAAALWFAYEVPAVANTGQTPGKRLLGIKVVPLEKEQPLSFGRSVRRWNPMGLPVLLWWCFGIGFLLQLLDSGYTLFDRPLRQALHDKSAHTAVVSISATGSGPSADADKEAPDEPADPR